VRGIAVVLGCLCFATIATASSTLDVTKLPRPEFPAPVTDVQPTGVRLALVSSHYHSPADPTRVLPDPAPWAPPRFHGEDLQFAIRQPPALVFFVYGRDGSSGRYLVAASVHTRQLRYAFDLVNFAHAPGGGDFEQVVWARESEGVLYVETAHSTYATATGGRNAYVTAVDIAKRRTLWRGPALVANARTFVLAEGYLVTGYGFTREDDFLYLLDRRNGHVAVRLLVPSAPEFVRLRGDRLHVRTYDHDVVVRLTG
jgi:hypothetical protein